MVACAAILMNKLIIFALHRGMEALIGGDLAVWAWITPTLRVTTQV